MTEAIAAEREQALVPLEAPERPRTREGCLGQDRPCPWVSCRHHLALDLSAQTGSIHLNADARGRRTLPVWQQLGADEWLERAADAVIDMPATCALDVADRGGVTLAEIAGLLGITRERARQIESTALAKLRVAADEGDDGDQAE